MDKATADPVAVARERVRLARQRELAAHRRAVALHKQAATLQERLGHPERAEQARRNAAHARQRIDRANEEQAAWEAELHG